MRDVLVIGGLVAMLVVGAGLTHSAMRASSSAGEPIRVLATAQTAQVEAPSAPVASASSNVPTVTFASLPANAVSGVPTVDVDALPRPSTGTVIGAPDHRLFIDGHVAPAWKALVKCGGHVVRVGSAGKPQAIDVPCGGEIEVR
jgi:hypothetical protein